MGKFAVMTLQCNSRSVYNKSAENDSFIQRAVMAFKGWRADRHIRIAATVQHREHGQELGYIVRLPDFILRWNTLPSGRRKKRLVRFVRLIKESGIEVMCVPFFHSILPAEAVEFLTNQLILSDGYNIRLITLADCVRHLMGILKNQLSSIEAGIWCADTEMGRLLARILMPYLNFMKLGGYSVDKLFELSDEIMHETGLACPVTIDLEECLKNRQFVVLTQRCDVQLLKNASIVVYTGPLDLEYMEEIRSQRGPFWILSGWTELPGGIEASAKLSSWETAGVLESMLYLLEKDSTLVKALYAPKLSQLSKLKDVFGEIKVHGFISIDGEVSYDRFRMRYFRKNDRLDTHYFRKT